MSGRSPPRPFPRTLVRDLQGLVRLLYRAEQAVDIPESYGRLGRLEEAGRALGEALTTARAGRVQVAYGWADKGARILHEIASTHHPELAEIVRTAALALRRTAPSRGTQS